MKVFMTLTYRGRIATLSKELTLNESCNNIYDVVNKILYLIKECGMGNTPREDS